MRSYHHFTKEDRSILSALKRKGLTQSEIARELNKSQPSISRELSRNHKNNEGYHAQIASQLAQQRQRQANQALKRIVNDSWLKRYIHRKLKKHWSPEQIAGRVRKDHNLIVCHETIYQYIYNLRPDFKQYLRCKKGKYRRRYGTKIKEKQREQAKKTRIDQRPKIIDQRKRLGDWEGDTIVGSDKHHILTHVERTSGILFGDKLDQVSAKHTKERTVSRFKQLPKAKRHSITYDNGATFSDYELTARDLELDIYFAYPYHSWERGCNENANGLLRQYFPKKTPLGQVTQAEIDQAVDEINSRPRKRLNYLTPLEVFKSGLCT
jgi:transposase, IS30 family